MSNTLKQQIKFLMSLATKAKALLHANVDNHDHLYLKQLTVMIG